jgi:hypothetical protein
MLRSSMSHRARWRFSTLNRCLWVRCLALLTVIFAVPACQQVVDEVASAVVADCGDDCADGGEDNTDCCPEGCSHCACCTPPSSLPSHPVPLVGAPRSLVAAPMSPDDAYAAGYRSPPFRPPTA